MKLYSDNCFYYSVIFNVVRLIMSVTVCVNCLIIPSKILICRLFVNTRVPTLLLTKNSRIFQDPTTFFQDSFIAQQCLNIQTNSSCLLNM